MAAPTWRSAAECSTAAKQRPEKLDRRWLKDGCVGQQAMMTKQWKTPKGRTSGEISSWIRSTLFVLYCWLISNRYNIEKLLIQWYVFPTVNEWCCSIATSTVPLQWKNAIISPVPKISSPKDCNDYSHSSLDTNHGEDGVIMVVRTFMYPALLTPPPASMFFDRMSCANNLNLNLKKSSKISLWTACGGAKFSYPVFWKAYPVSVP